MGIFKPFVNQLMELRNQAWRENLSNILNLVEEDPASIFLDLGCDDGKWTTKVANKIKTKSRFGTDVIKHRLALARKKNIVTQTADLNEKLPYKNNSFDIVHSNQVIEHLNNTDKFVSEIYRVLKPKGYAIVSTENLASWHNIFALILGYMPFSLTGVTSRTAALGNPLDVHTGEEFSWDSSAWQHQRVFTLKGLKHLFELHGFKIEKVLTSGYYPLPNFFANLDKYHSAFIVLKIRK